MTLVKNSFVLNKLEREKEKISELLVELKMRIDELNTENQIY
jgi:hypothetical protein